MTNNLNSPVGRVGTPEDIAGLVSYLASKDSSMVTGTFATFDPTS